MLDTFKNNSLGITLWALAVCAVVGLASLGGCQFEDMVKVNTPPAVQSTLGVPPRTTLRHAYGAFADWKAYVNRNTQEYVQNIQQGEEWLAFFQSTANMGLGMVTQSGLLAAIPGGSILIGILAGAGGLAFNRPGTDRRIAKEKEASYAKGKEDAEEAFKLANGHTS